MQVHVNPFPGIALLRTAVICFVMGFTSLRSPGQAQTGGVSQPEYEALVSIYQATGGAAWAISEGWLTAAPVSEWYGVVVEDGKVVGLDLSSNNLTGSFPKKAQHLPLRNLALVNNRLKALEALPATLLTLSASSNQLGALPALPAGLQFLDVSTNQLTCLPALPASLSVISAGSNRLALLPALPAALTSLSVPNNLLYGLPALPASLLSLEAGTNRIIQLPTLPATLSFLSVSSNRLFALPALPAGLSFVNCSFNRLSGLPALPASLSILLCANNRLTFEDLEPNMGKLFDPVLYSPQADVGLPQARTLTAGSSLTLSANFAGNSPNNQYVWLKDTTVVAGPSASPFFTIAGANAASAGVYTALITNTVVRGLTIRRRPVTVAVSGTAPSARQAAAGQANALRVTPNPFRSSVRLQGRADGPVSIVVTDGQGRVVLQSDAHAPHQPLQLDDRLPAGVYLMRVRSEGNTETVRLVKQ